MVCILPQGHVRTLIAPSGYSMTLFQSWATKAGWDPVRGPGSSCLDANASGQCVLPWGSGTKSVSSIVLVANGVSFAVRTNAISQGNVLNVARLGHDRYLHNYRLGR